MKWPVKGPVRVAFGALVVRVEADNGRQLRVLAGKLAEAVHVLGGRLLRKQPVELLQPRCKLVELYA